MESSRLMAWRDAFAEPERWLLGGLILILLLFIGRELWTTVDAALYNPAGPAASTATAQRAEDATEHIASANLFGAAPQSLRSGDQSLPETNLQLTLRGVFAARDPGLASAIIETGDGRAQVVRVGVSVAEGTVLQQVYDNRVVLARNGTLENLYFPAPQEGESGIAVSQDSGGPEPGAELQQDGAPAPTPADMTAEEKRAAVLRRLEELRLRSSR